MKLKKILDIAFIISKGERYNGKEVARFTETEIKNLISIYGTLQLMKIPINSLNTYEKWFNIISKGSNFILNIVREYILKMLEVCPDSVTIEIEYLKQQLYDLSLYYRNKELFEFSAEFVIDEIILLRNYKFGTFCMDRLSGETFKDISKVDLDKFSKRIHRANIMDFNEKILKRISKKAPKIFNLEDYKLLLRLFKYQFH